MPQIQICKTIMSKIEIAAYWRLLLPIRELSPVIKRPNHSVSVGAVVKYWRPLSLHTDFAVDPPSAIDMKMLECTDCALRSEENFSLALCLTGLLYICITPMDAHIPPQYSCRNVPIGCVNI